ncbi:endonuclease/exonuclease/phosphatase family protein [Streptomyces nojiriensis]|uniref:endonuclease/exonuclease/phosphatase family protein n=1 Tax=Streptomyces nojiriensis TaxID=66374 RepID=UPI0036571661
MVIGTCNLENLCRPLPPGGPPSNRCASRDEAAYQAKLAGLAATIGHLAPDLLGVQEVGSREALADLADRLDGDWHIALSTHPDRRGIGRAAEAVTMRFVADQLLRGDGRAHEVIVMGDLNDEFKAATTQILYGPPGSQIGTGGFQDSGLGDPRRLWNLAPRILEQGGFSRVFEGQKELIDHILVSRALLPRLERVFTGHERLPALDGAHPAAPHDSPSDHAPVLAVLDY